MQAAIGLMLRGRVLSCRRELRSSTDTIIRRSTTVGVAWVQRTGYGGDYNFGRQGLRAKMGFLTLIRPMNGVLKMRIAALSLVQHDGNDTIDCSALCHQGLDMA
jgi:hypothetical protein